ncbi:hypothetical protein ACFL1H_05515, partial [Nanoarchaeota archaeon]
YILNKTVQKKIFEQNITFPETTNTKSIPIKIRADYQTEHFEKLSIEEKFNIKLIPKGEIKINHRPEKTNIYELEEINFETIVDNRRKTNVNNIKISDSIPEQFNIIGITNRTFDLNADSSKTVYIYKIKLPEVQEDTRYYINSTLYFLDNGIIKNATLSTSILVQNNKDFNLDISKELEETNDDFYLGEIINTEYVIKNNENENSIYNIILNFPLQQNVDLINTKQYEIAQLNPGEQLTIDNIEKIRPKINGTIWFDKTIITYKDQDGLIKHLNTSDLKKTIKNSYLAGPAIMAYMSIPNKKVYVNEPVKINIKISNIGDKETYLDINLTKNVKVNIGPYTDHELTFEKQFDTPGKYLITPAEIRYNYLNDNYYTISNSEEIEVIDKPIEKEEISDDKEDKEETTKHEEEPKEIKKSFWDKVGDFFVGAWDFLKGIFTWSRSR